MSQEPIGITEETKEYLEAVVRLKGNHDFEVFKAYWKQCRAIFLSNMINDSGLTNEALRVLQGKNQVLNLMFYDLDHAQDRLRNVAKQQKEEASDVGIID